MICNPGPVWGVGGLYQSSNPENSAPRARCPETQGCFVTFLEIIFILKIIHLYHLLLRPVHYNDKSNFLIFATFLVDN